MPTSLPRWRSSLRSRRRWKGCATQSSPSFMLTLVAPQKECQEVCLTWVAWVVHPVLLVELAALGLPLRRLTNLSNFMSFADSSEVEQRLKSLGSKYEYVKLKVIASLLALKLA